MNKPMMRTHNLQTGEIVDREMTDDEIAAREAIDAVVLQESNSITEARQALLAKLGITEEEAKLLLS
jgi:hypothetical protein